MTGEWVIAGVEVVVKRSARRRTVALQVQPDAVTLYAPQGVPLAKLRDILDARRDWVARHLAQYAARPTSGLRFECGAPLPFLGETLTLTLDPAVRTPRREDARLLVTPGTPQDVQLRVEAWTRRACLPTYRTLVAGYAAQLGASARLREVRVTNASQRWGSCSGRGDIRLHWKLSRAPLDVLRYVALHEAAHLLELNHSRRYWAHVQRLMPDWPTHRQWLQEYGSTL